MGFVDRADAGLLAETGERGRVYYLMHATQDGVLARYDDALWHAGDREGLAADSRLVLSVPSHDLNDELYRRALTLEAWAGQAGYVCRVLAPGRRRATTRRRAARRPLTRHRRDRARPGLARRRRASLRSRALCRIGGSGFSIDPTDGVGHGPHARRGRGVAPRGREFDRDLALPVQPALWDVAPDPALRVTLGDGKANCLFAGPLTPNSCSEQLMAAFAFLVALEVDARLVLAVSFDDPRYAETINALIEEHRLGERIVFIDPRDARALATAYRHASIFWSMSEGAEPRVPYVDALWHDVPVLAFSTPRLVRLLGPAGLLFRKKNDPLALAALAKLLIRDRVLRGRVRQAQESRRAAFTLDLAAGGRLAGTLLGRVAVPAG